MAGTSLHLPREPYPGLRPFLSFEAALLFGRQRQVREIIDRLAASQFVAVLGGSGSGKSSLIHAGVTPELRSYGIPGAGDLWLPLVCTPGTNVSAADQAARRHSPVTRLVRRFGQLLKSRGSPAADEARLLEMAEVFRQEDGFARLLEAYGHELDVPTGPDAADARVLFVIDQFEEVFHPTNKPPPGTPNEAAVLVERLLDHFFRPHARCYVVITMRSEHLNDCATYLELPDAINKSSFLLRRLDADELREAIVGPAQRFLRLKAREAAGALATATASATATAAGSAGSAAARAAAAAAARLPAQVVFEPAVLERLVRDVTAITHDPDHLPLLQHMLARLWQAALERQDEMDAEVPAGITWVDLVRAVNADERVGHGGPGAIGGKGVLAEHLNTLRESVHNWPERIYRLHDAAHRVQLDALLRRLALKDPNTGHYTQQRIEATAAAALLGLPAGAAGPQQLRRLLSEGFLGTVDYLFWDNEDPARVTIKVSHESFIRGWRRFKSLIDAESAQYEEYLGVLRRCAAWVENLRQPEDLLAAGELRRVSAGAVQKRRQAKLALDDWQQLLALDREGARLLPHAGEVPAFIDESERMERRRTLRRRLWPAMLITVSGITLGLVLPALFAIFIEGPTMRRAELMLDASGTTEAAEVKRHYASRAEALASLRPLLDAAARIDGARAGTNTTLGHASARLIHALDGVALVRRQGDFLQGVLSQTEPVVLDKLREVLATSPLLAVPVPSRTPDAAAEVFNGECSVPQITAPSRGRIVVAAKARSGADAGAGGAAASAPAKPAGARRALFIPEAAGGAGAHRVVYAATWSSAEGLCRQGPLLMVLDAEGESHAVFDQGLQYAITLTEQGTGEAALVTLQQVNWRLSAEGEVQRAQRATVVTLVDPALAERLRQAGGAARLAIARSWSVPAGRVLEVGGEGWRIVSWQSRRMRDEWHDDRRGAWREEDFQLSVPAPPGTPCRRLADHLDQQAAQQAAQEAAAAPGLRSTMLDAGDLCLAVYRTRQIQSAVREQGSSQAQQELAVWVYPRPLPGTLARLAQRPLLPLAAVSPFATLPVEAGGAQPRWALGRRGEYAGWLVLRGAGGVVHGLPLTTCALWRFGRALLPAAEAGEAPAQTCSERP